MCCRNQFGGKFALNFTGLIPKLQKIAAFKSTGKCTRRPNANSKG
jgi:hypothetical protein